MLRKWSFFFRDLLLRTVLNDDEFAFLMLCIGVYYFAESERTYEGNFSQNLFEGKGKLTYKDGRCYVGDFKQGKKDGNGTMVLPNGNKYIGQWENDTKHGIGI